MSAQGSPEEARQDRRAPTGVRLTGGLCVSAPPPRAESYTLILKSNLMLAPPARGLRAQINGLRGRPVIGRSLAPAAPSIDEPEARRDGPVQGLRDFCHVLDIP